MNILISGTPGTGKSEVADILAESLKMKVIHVSELVDDFCIGNDKERNTKIVDEKKLSEYLNGFDNVIIETHLPVKVNATCFVLRCDISELGKRLRKRGWSKKKIDENIQAEIFDVCADELRDIGHGIVEIDTTGKSAEETASRIKCILNI